MKKTIALIMISILFFFEGCSHPNEENNTSKQHITSKSLNELVLLKRVITKYNPISVLFAIYSLEKEFLQKNDSSVNALKLGLLNQIQEVDSVNTILINYERELIKIDKQNQQVKITNISDWCSFYFMFNCISNMNYPKPIYIEQILFELPETKQLFNNYLGSPKQDWASLDVNQTSELYFDFIKYFVKLEPKKRIKLISKFILSIEIKQKEK